MRFCGSPSRRGFHVYSFLVAWIYKKLAHRLMTGIITFSSSLPAMGPDLTRVKVNISLCAFLPINYSALSEIQ